MNTLNECPCCSEPLLRHFRHGHLYWFCRHCHQEMPNLTQAVLSPAQVVPHHELTKLLNRI